MMRANPLVPELSVTSFAESIRFYVHILGFAIAYQREEEGFAFLTLGEAHLMIDAIGEGRTWKTGALERPLGRGINLQIEVASVDALREALLAHNVTLFLDIEEKWYRQNDKEVGSRQFLVQDPDGYLLRFAQDLGERPATERRD